MVNALSISIKSTGKKTLILDLCRVNIWKAKFNFEDIRNASIYLPTDNFMFKFDLKPGYHHIDILDEHQTFLGFSWVVNGVRNFLAFTVLPFRLSSASHIFTKVVRVLVRFRQTHGVRITVNLDGGLGSACHYASSRAASTFLKSRFCLLVSFPMTVNLFGSLLPAWRGWDYVLICTVAIFPLSQRGLPVMNMLCTLSMLNTYFLLLENWRVL